MDKLDKIKSAIVSKESGYRKAIFFLLVAVMIAVALKPRVSAATGDWYQDGEVMKVRDKNGNSIKNAWFCDTNGDGKEVWYILDANGAMVTDGLVRDLNGNMYSIETSPDKLGQLRVESAIYDGISLDIISEHSGRFGAVVNQEGIDALKNMYGITEINFGGGRSYYASEIYTTAPVQPPSDAAATGQTPGEAGGAGGVVAEVFALVNEERAKGGLPPMVMSEKLNALAAVRAQELTTKYAHIRPDGSDVGYEVLDVMGFSWAGENIAYGQKTAEEVMSNWMASPTHKFNIMNESFSCIGIGSVTSGSRTYWVQIFSGY